MRRLSRFPPFGIGGMLLMMEGAAGARPMQPMWRLTGTLKGGSSPYSVMMSGSLVSRPGQ